MHKKLVTSFLLLAILSCAYAVFLAPKALTNTGKRTAVICRNPNSNVTDPKNEFGENVIKCDKDEIIKIDEAVFGIKDKEECPIVASNENVTNNQGCDESIQTEKIVKKICENHRKCKIDVRNTQFPVACPTDAYQALVIKFHCNGKRIKFHPFVGNSFGGRGQQRLKLNRRVQN